MKLHYLRTIGEQYNAIQNFYNPLVTKFRHMPARWHNGRGFVFCLGDCPFESEPTPTFADACEEVTGWDAGCQKVSSVVPEMDLRELHYYIITLLLLQTAKKAECTLA